MSNIISQSLLSPVIKGKRIKNHIFETSNGTFGYINIIIHNLILSYVTYFTEDLSRASNEFVKCMHMMQRHAGNGKKGEFRIIVINHKNRPSPCGT